MSDAPRVSVIVPLFNLRALVAATVESVLAQTLPADEIELVVVDDGSTDGGGDVVARYAPRVRCVRQENRGLAAARNAGLRLTRAPFVMFLDADDAIEPDALAAHLPVLFEYPHVTVSVSGWRCVTEVGTPLPQGWWEVGREGPGRALQRLLLGDSFPVHAAVVRRTVIERVGGFDEALGALEDWDLWLRIARLGGAWTFIQAPLARYTIRGGSMHSDAALMLHNRLRVLDGFFRDPGLPRDVAALRVRAIASAHLAAACAYYRAGDERAGAGAFASAVEHDPTLVSDPRGLRRICRMLLPTGEQSEAAVVADWRRITRILGRMLADVGRRSGRSRTAYWRTVARYARKRIFSHRAAAMRA